MMKLFLCFLSAQRNSAFIAQAEERQAEIEPNVSRGADNVGMERAALCQREREPVMLRHGPEGQQSSWITSLSGVSTVPQPLQR